MMRTFIIGYKSELPQTFCRKEVSEIRNTHYVLGNLLVDKTSPHYPGRSDEKIMREDVKAAVILIKNLLSEVALQGKIANTPLFVSNGASVEDLSKPLKRIIGAYRKFDSKTTEQEKVRQTYKASPPLIALETLTNATMSFVAQYAGFKNNNTTVGNTSISSYYALKEAIFSLRKAKEAVVLASNCSGDQSFLTNSSVLQYADSWKESAAVGCVVLSRKKENALCEVTHFNNSTIVPNLESIHTAITWDTLLPDRSADAIVFSGGFTSEANLEEEGYCSKLCNRTISLFNDYGNLGSANIMASIGKGIALINQGSKIIDVLDRDIYGRECLIRLERC